MILMHECNTGTRILQKDKAKTFERSKTDIATSQFSLSQMIKEATNILSNLVFFIDLVYIIQSNLTH